MHRKEFCKQITQERKDFMKNTNTTPERQIAAQGNLAGQFDTLEGREIVARREEFVKHFDLGAGRR